MTSGAVKRLILLRHGRTAWNAERRAQGQAQVPLDEFGLAQAVAIAPLIAELEPARLWASDLRRADQTAQAVASATGLEIEPDPRLREFSVGEREGMTWAEALRHYPEMATAKSLGEALRAVPGAESDDDVYQRIVPAVREHLDSLEVGQVGVVVSHGAAIKLALAGLLHQPQSFASALTVLDNCCWASVQVTAEPGAVPRLIGYGVGRFASTGAIG